jgi:hypothetical protein
MLETSYRRSPIMHETQRPVKPDWFKFAPKSGKGAIDACLKNGIALTPNEKLGLLAKNGRRAELHFGPKSGVGVVWYMGCLNVREVQLKK